MQFYMFNSVMKGEYCISKMSLMPKTKRVRKCCVSNCGNLDFDESLSVTSPFLRALILHETDGPHYNQNPLTKKYIRYVGKKEEKKEKKRLPLARVESNQLKLNIYGAHIFEIPVHIALPVRLLPPSTLCP